MEYFVKALKHYADFSGRSRRKDYWMFFLFLFIFGIASAILDNIFGMAFWIGYGPIYMLFTLAMFIPHLAAGVRRLHDIGKSGWMLLVVLIPFIGIIWLIILLATEGNKGENQYGQDPKALPVA
jgi:uncharacterized membrane protein YhaH (DUF805 family)